MDIEEYYNFYHIDIATQIENKWKTDTVLAVVKGLRKYAIKIRGRDKEKIKKRFVSKGVSRSERKHNKRVVAIVYSYLLHEALKNFDEAKPVLLCRDVRPERWVMQYLQRIANYFNNKKVMDREIGFRKREDKNQERLPKSLAGKYVRKVYQRKFEPNKILSGSEVEELIEIIGKIL